jgi:hypothetical protein
MGLVLLELLTGTKAFPGTAIESLVARTLRSPDIPAHLGAWVPLLRSVTAMDPRERPTAEQAAAMAALLIPAAPAPSLVAPASRNPDAPCQSLRVFPPRRHRQKI